MALLSPISQCCYRIKTDSQNRQGGCDNAKWGMTYKDFRRDECTEQYSQTGKD